MLIGDPAAVLVSGAAAAELAPWLVRQLAAETRRAGGAAPVGRLGVALVGELDQAARRHRAVAAHEAGGVPVAEPAEQLVAELPASFVSTSEAACRAGVSEGLVRRWCRDGHLPAHRAGKAWLIDPCDLDEFVAERADRKDGDGW